ncbi:MAG: helix-turn-helix domain-containing protein [Myxococcaceae bacterium]
MGQRIRELRTQRPDRWTQEDLSQRARISVSFLSMIERGERVPHLETLVALTRALGVRLVDVFVESPADPEGLDNVVQPLVDFVRVRRLGARDIEKLLGVARALFDGPETP